MAQESSSPSLLLLGAALAVEGATGVPIEIGTIKVPGTSEPVVRLTFFILGCLFFSFGFLKDAVQGNPDKSRSRRSILVFCIITFLIFGIPCSIGLSGRPILAAISAAIILVLAFATRSYWAVQYSSQTKQRFRSLLFLTTIAAIYLFPLEGFMVRSLSAFKIELQDPIAIPRIARITSATAHVLSFAVVLAVNLWRYRKEISHVPQKTKKQDTGIGADEYFAALERYTQALIADLDRYDRDVNWSDRDLAPLEAEVETERENGAQPQILHDLVEGIRSNRNTDVFVVVGDPGSGKSVSLRRLARQLCSQAFRSGIVPVYANLREFPANVGLSESSLMAFIKDCAARQTGRDGRNFLDQWYEYFRKNGRLFFILDSFDELPAVLDADENTQTHKNISASFDRLFSQELQGCRAVLASRPFRAPSAVKSSRILIRPFSEKQIRAAMRTWLSGRGIKDREYVIRLFKERPQIVPMLRNPFLAELIAEYAISNHGTKLPDGMYAVFDEFIERRLEGDKEQLQRMGTSSAQVRSAAGHLALGMYRSGDIGLEIEREKAVTILSENYRTKESILVDAICYTRLGRIGGSGIKKFSFAHRRFAEFFVVDTVDEQTILQATQSIPKDSRWRDCLVMYSGVADPKTREQIALLCWTTINQQMAELVAGNLANSREAIHCARFLADAFRSNPEAMVSFRTALTEAVLALLKSNDILVVKIGAELIPLIEQDSIPKALSLGLGSDSRWVSETTLSSCRHLANVPVATLRAIDSYLCGHTTFELIQKFSELRFSFSLSDSFKLHRQLLWVLLAESLICWAVSLVILLQLSLTSPAIPVIGIAFGAALSSFLYILYSNNPKQRPHRTRYVELGFITASAFAACMLYVAAEDSTNIKQYLWYDEAPSSPLLNVGHLMNASSTLAIARMIGGIGIVWMAGYALWSALRAKHQWTRFILFLKTLKNENISKVLLVPLPYVALIVFIRYGTDIFPPAFIRIIAVIAKACMWIFGSIFVLLLLVSCWHQIRGQFRETMERRRLRKISVPNQISSSQVYSAALAFRESAIRREYLDLIRSRHIPLTGQIEEPPKELLEIAGTKEALAKLHSQWLGLDA